MARVPVRLMVHFQIARRPLVQVTEGESDGTRVRGVGTRALDTARGTDDLDVFDPTTGQRTGERISVDRALQIIYSLTKR